MCFDLVHLELPDLPESANTCFMAQYRIIDDQSFPTCLFLQLHYAEANESTCPFHGELSRSSLLNFHNKCPVFPHTLMAGILWSCLVSYFQSNIHRQWKLLKAGKGWGWKKLKCWLLRISAISHCFCLCSWEMCDSLVLACSATGQEVTKIIRNHKHIEFDSNLYLFVKIL